MSQCKVTLNVIVTSSALFGCKNLPVDDVILQQSFTLNSLHTFGPLTVVLFFFFDDPSLIQHSGKTFCEVTGFDQSREEYFLQTTEQNFNYSDS